ncbi:MAG: lysozyme [Candidatus Avigastranaerophilus sp.]
MKISENGINLIKQFETLVLYTYDDLDMSNPKRIATEKTLIKGTLTIGYGHTGSDVKVGMSITKEDAEKLLLNDLQVAEKAVNGIVKIPLNQNQYDALVSFTFNCGSSNLKKLVNNRNCEQISKAILLYNKSKGKVCNGLIKRREAEQKLFIA